VRASTDLTDDGRAERWTLADVFCREARGRIGRTFDQLFGPDDMALSRLARQVLDGEHQWLEAGIVGLKSGD